MPCPHSDELEPEWCSNCKAAAAPAPARNPFLEPGPLVVAQYPGRCGCCEFDINPGEPIRWTSLGWAHDGCVP